MPKINLDQQTKKLVIAILIRHIQNKMN